VNSQVILPIHHVKGSILTPASKSHAQRVLACALMNPNRTIIRGIGFSDDELAVLGVLISLGARIEKKEDALHIQGIDFAKLSKKDIFIGESGLASRMLTPIMALGNETITITGNGSILQRPMDFFEAVLPQLYVQVSSNSGKLPLNVSGPLIPKDITVDGSLSSQFITGLILAFVGSPLTKNEVITIENPTSIPYIELTIQTLQDFGHKLKFDGSQVHFNGPYEWEETGIQIEGDWSSAAFFMVAAALFGSITFENLSLNSSQADKAILNVLEEFGAEIKIEENTISISKKDLLSFHFDATHSPDLFPILAVLGAYGTETSSIKGVHRLLNKESNRAEVILSEFSKFGLKMHIENDTLFILPQKTYTGATIDPNGDHRMVMSATIFALGTKEKTTLLHPEVCAKSFPSFFEILESIQSIKD
jgi:3-phosphoshikimate 1-carboxyvinyltransferase